MTIDELLHHKYKEVDTIVMSLYEVILTKDTQVLTNQDIIDYKLIHDARLTKEYGILNEFKLKNLGDVWFKALWDMSDKDGVWFFPYDEPKTYDRKFASLPMVITDTTVRNVPELKLFMTW